MPRVIKTETHVKELVKDWYKRRDGWRYSPVQNALGEHGIPDSVGGIPLIVTPAMVGKMVNLSVTVEAKKPGRRGQKDRGMSKHQVLFIEKVRSAGGFAICCDGAEDLAALDGELERLQNG